MDLPPNLPPRLPPSHVVRRFATEPYQPDGGCDIVGLISLSLIISLGAIAAGWLASFIGQWFYLIVLFPVGIGICVSLVGAYGVTLWKVRNVALASVIALAASGLAIVSRHYFDYLRFLPTLPDLQKLAAMPPGQRPADPALKEEINEIVRLRSVLANADSFPGYLEFEARLGINISSRSAKGINTGYVGTLIYWVAEYVVVALIVLIGMRGSAREPFCGNCQQWKTDRNVGTLVGDRETMLEALREGDLPRLIEPDQGQGQEALVVTLSVCQQCATQCPIVVKLNEIKESKSRHANTEVAWLTYPGEALDSLETAIAVRSGAISTSRPNNGPTTG